LKTELTQNIHLQSITKNDCAELFELMTDIYPKSYDYLWNDCGQWYLHFVYDEVKVLEDLAEPNSPYFFVLVNHEKVGVLRIQHDEIFATLAAKTATKLHRIYLHPKVHGMGIGQALMNWTIEETRKQGNEILWLEAMDSKTDALKFYKKCRFEIGNHVTLPYNGIFLALRGMHQLWRNV
jgi:GNAT superfamily N-acetyltransferase